jgi:hypothetical protein
MEQLEKIQRLSELLNKFSHGIEIDFHKKKNIFEVLLLIGQIDDYKYLDIESLNKLEILIKSLKRVLLFNKK